MQYCGRPAGSAMSASMTGQDIAEGNALDADDRARRTELVTATSRTRCGADIKHGPATVLLCVLPPPRATVLRRWFLIGSDPDALSDAEALLGGECFVVSRVSLQLSRTKCATSPIHSTVGASGGARPNRTAPVWGQTEAVVALECTVRAGVQHSSSKANPR